MLSETGDGPRSLNQGLAIVNWGGKQEKMQFLKTPPCVIVWGGGARRWGTAVRLDLNNIIQAISWLLSSVQQKGYGGGKRTQFTSNISAATNDLQPIQKWLFYAKANKMHKNLTAVTVPSANVLATQGSLQGAGCD